MIAGAGAAAARAARRRREEEEAMTKYTDADLTEGWELKILRSATSAFRNPDQLRQVLEEESRAGWTLVEKFDNQRLRLKRPATARSADSTLDFDPYRTAYGMSEGKLTLLIVGTILGSVALLLLLIFLAVNSR